MSLFFNISFVIFFSAESRLYLDMGNDDYSCHTSNDKRMKIHIGLGLNLCQVYVDQPKGCTSFMHIFMSL